MRPLPRGILPPVVTTFRGEVLDCGAFRANLQAFNSTELAGYVVLGSNGEGIYLDDDEALRVADVAAEARSPDKFLIVGTGRESTRATIALTRRAGRAGADAVLVTPPAYYRASMTPAALEFHYQAVADAAEVPVLLYHVPRFCPVTFEPAWVCRLACHPNIAGLKDSSADVVFLTTCLKDRPGGFRVYVGTANLLLAGLVLGADGGILALANVAPQECVELLRLVERGEIECARALQHRLLALNETVTTRHGVPGLKLAMDLVGLHGGEARRPLSPLSPENRQALQAALRQAAIRPLIAAGRPLPGDSDAPR
jgi:4-hydroxy-2-oxoglutarate aldolase